MRYKVVEIFDSVQGEGSHLGRAVTFVRLAGCNLTCTFCDTKESWSTKNAAEMTADEIVEQCTTGVVLTGGEPCTQDLTELIAALKKKGCTVALETNGTLPTPDGIDWVTVSPKPPHYTVHKDCNYDEVKVVITKDLAEERLFVLALEIGKEIWLQPDGFDMEDSAKRSYKLVMKYPDLFRLGIQMHKIFEFR